MKLSAFKNNQLISEIDLTSEIAGAEDSKRSFFIGRSNDCHLIIKDIGISREHIQINYDNGKWSLKNNADFGMVSLNGSLLDEGEIKNGDIIAVGAFQIMISGPNNIGMEQNVSFDDSPNASEDTDNPQEPSEKNLELPSSVQFDELPKDGQAESSSMEDADKQNNEEEQNMNEGNQEDSPPVDASNENPTQDNDMQISDDFNIASDDNPISDSPEGDFSDPPSENNDEMNLVSTEDTADDDQTGLLSSFVKYELELLGECAPYDKYLIEHEETFIGRDPQKCQIILHDTEVSVVHAVIKYSKGLATIEDLNSSNGTIYNGKRTNKASFASGDEFIIGSTTFTVKIKSDLLEQESGRLMPVESAKTNSLNLSDIGSVLSSDTDQGNEDQASSKNQQSSLGNMMSDPQKKGELLYTVLWPLFYCSYYQRKIKNPKIPKRNLLKKRNPISW